MAENAPSGSDRAPDPDSTEFLQGQNTVERASPGADADDVAVDPELLSTEPGGGPGPGAGRPDPGSRG